jgi:hypothetical protein
MPSAIASLVTPLSKPSLGLSEALVRDVPANKFARLAAPGGVKIESNHPAFCLGHLAIYPARLAEAMGINLPGVTAPAGFVDLFSAGKPCLDDPEGTIYPKMETITKAYFDNYRGIVAAIETADPAAFDRPHPNEKMRERFPSVGMLAVFLVTSHVMMHLGQVSAWRRMMGMAPVQM